MKEENASSGVSAPPPARKRGSRSTSFKGVVLQQNGHWGAQIYAHHQRVWLGTFTSEAEAAAAYDSAAIRLRPGDSHRNLPPSSSAAAAAEPRFQAGLATDALLAMIKDGSYPAKLDEFVRAAAAGPGLGPGPAGGVAVEHLFRKELTPSDVGKLNRLVIPKRHAVKHFPGLAGSEGSRVVAFRDSGMREWKFRYCYWRSSQSFVFTRGWNRFVREKKLREKDAVAFYSCRGGRGDFFLIDVVQPGDADSAPSNSNSNGGGGGGGGKGLSVLLNLSQCANSDDLDQKVVEDQELPKKPEGGFMLFGVQIYASE